MKGCGKVQEIHVETNDVRILVGSQHRIIIDKLYGPTCVPNLVITWDGDDWNVRKANARLRSALRSCQKKDSLTLTCPHCKRDTGAGLLPLNVSLDSQETDSAAAINQGESSRPDIHTPKASLSMGTSSGKVLGHVDTNILARIKSLEKEIYDIEQGSRKGCIGTTHHTHTKMELMYLREGMSEILDAVEHDCDYEIIMCGNCNGEGEIESRSDPTNDGYDLHMCDVCEGKGSIEVIRRDVLKEKLAKMREEIGK